MLIDIIRYWNKVLSFELSEMVLKLIIVLDEETTGLVI